MRSEQKVQPSHLVVVSEIFTAGSDTFVARSTENLALREDLKFCDVSLGFGDRCVRDMYTLSPSAPIPAV